MVINFFWEEKFHAANGKAQAHTECALHFFLLNLGGGGFKGGYFSVFPGSHYVDHTTIRSLWLAKNGDKFFLGREISCSQWEGPSTH
jgi:hypothetical protein